MKLQIGTDHLRVRIDEAELARLLQSQRLELAPALAGRPLLTLTVWLDDATALIAQAEHWCLQLERARVHAYTQTLPCRESLHLPIEHGPRVDFDVDVRDSVRTRGARHARVAGMADGAAKAPP